MDGGGNSGDRTPYKQLQQLSSSGHEQLPAGTRSALPDMRCFPVLSQRLLVRDARY